MKAKIYDLPKTLRKYSNEWLALDPKEMKVVGVGRLPKQALNASRKKGVDHPVLTRAPKDYGTYIL